MKLKYTALPVILALAAGGCSNTPTYYPNFKACYNDTGDANQCLQYIDENGRTNTQSSNLTDPSYTQPMNTTSGVSNDGFDGSSALIGAAAGAAAGYGLANNNNEKRRQNAVVAPVTNSNDNTRNNGSTTPAKTTSSKSTPAKSSTTRGGFGSTGSKSFGG